MDKETVKTVAQYYGIYMYISEEPRSRDDCATFATKELKMNRSQYIRYLISGQKRVLIPSVKYKELVTKISQIDLSLRVIALKDEISTEDKLLILTELTEIKRILTGMDTFGHDDQKLEEEE